MANTDLWGVTETGFYRPTIDEIIAEKEKEAKTRFGQNFKTDEKTPQGKLFRINAAAESKLCEIAEGIYYSIFPSTARGISLDRVCEFVNLEREIPGRAVHAIKVYGEKDHVISEGTLFKNASQTKFRSLHDATINVEEKLESGEVNYFTTVFVECTQSGTIGNVQNINDTVNADASIYRVEYDSTISDGTPIETDPELRERFAQVVQGLGTNTVASIKANVLRETGVNDVIIIDNNTNKDVKISDSLVIASQSYAVIVYANSDTNTEQIAQAIFEKQPLGIRQSGKTSVKLVDESGMPQEVKFTYVEPVAINVTVDCTVDDTFASGGRDSIKENLSKYINGLGIGKEVVFSRLYDCIYNVGGVYKITNVTMNNGTDDIPISRINIAKASELTVNVTEV